MGLSDVVLRNLGKLFRNVTDPNFLAATAAAMVVQEYFISPLGHKAHAYLRAHLFDGDKKIGEVYECGDGHQYVKTNDGSKYALHPRTEKWHDA